jgi:hypothetical protein
MAMPMRARCCASVSLIEATVEAHTERCDSATTARPINKLKTAPEGAAFMCRYAALNAR